MLRSVLLIHLLASTLLLVAGSLGSAQSSSELLVVPGKALGRFNLEWTLEQFRQVLGREEQVATFQARAIRGTRILTFQVYAWGSRGLNVQQRPDLGDRTVGITVQRSSLPEIDESNKQYRTTEGFGLTSSRSDIEKMYGRPDFEYAISPTGGLFGYFAGIMFLFPTNNPDALFAMRVIWVPGWE